MALTPNNGYLIPLLKAKGRLTFLSLSFANLVIKRLNALLNLKVQEGDQYDFKLSDANAILTIKRQLESQSSTTGGSSLQVYKITSIANIASDYIAAKTVAFDNINTETLGSSAVNIAIPWSLRNANVTARLPEYAVNQYILVTTCDNGTGVVVSGAQLTLEDLGIGRIDGRKTMLCTITAINQDHIVATTDIDGTTSVKIARSLNTRAPSSDTVFGNSVTYGSYNSDYTARTATISTVSEKQVIIPELKTGLKIYAQPVDKTGITVSSVELTLIDADDSRAWCRKHDQS